MQQRAALDAADAVAQQKALDAIALAQQKHSNEIVKIDEKQALLEKSLWATLSKQISQSMETAFAGILKGTMSVGDGLRKMAQGVAGAFADMASKNIASMLQQAATGDTIKLKEIEGNAETAASGAYSAVAGIPYVGPFLAPIAAAGAYSATMAFASASGGYDIPGGINPVVQTHAKEMILPAHLAEAVRGMAAGGGGGGGQVKLNVSPLGDKHYIVTKDNLAMHLKNLHRRGALA